MNTEDSTKVVKTLTKAALISTILFGTAALVAAASLWR